MEKYHGKYRIESARLKNWDYGSPGFYFVTIVTRNRECYFGDIVTARGESGTGVVETQNFASLQPSTIGAIAQQYWMDIPKHFPFVELDEWVVMPNHLHGIIFINKPNYSNWEPNKFGPQSMNLGSIMRGYKAGVKSFATTNEIVFTWQSKFHDHIIRSEEELNRIRQYIIDNPKNWERDRNNQDNLFM